MKAFIDYLCELGSCNCFNYRIENENVHCTLIDNTLSIYQLYIITFKKKSGWRSLFMNISGLRYSFYVQYFVPRIQSDNWRFL